MFEKLPAPDDRPFPGQAPVQLTTFQMDFEEERPLRPQDGIQWKKALTDRGYSVPRLVSVRQQTASIEVGGGPAQASITAERKGWQALLGDGAGNAAVYSTGVRVERLKYPGFVAFRKEIEDVCSAVQELVGPTVQTRISLTYANSFSDPSASSAAFWRGKIRPNFLGPIADDGLTDELARGFMGYVFQNDDMSVDLRFGIQPDQVYQDCIAYVFQMEVAQNGIRQLDLKSVTATLDEIHLIALKVFFAILEPEYVKDLRGDKAPNAK